VKRLNVYLNRADHGGAAPPTVTSTSLLDRARGGDDESWRRLTRLYSALVYHWCRLRGLQSHDAADVVQEVFRSVATHLHTFEPQTPGASFRKWLRTITENKIRDHWRRAQRQPQATGGSDAAALMAEQPQEATTEAPSDDESEMRHVLRQAMELVRSDVEPQTWQAFWQTAVEGRPAADVAAELGLSPTTVRVARSRVRSRLRQEFGDLLD
jgi:RNA polymerase sigma-70 factor (ECF subfamily)